MIELTDEEKARFVRWVIENLDDRIVPGDEGNGDALVYNIVHMICGDRDRYHYRTDQDLEIARWHEESEGHEAAEKGASL